MIMAIEYPDLGTAVNQAFEDMKWDFTEVFFREQIARPMELAILSVEEYVRNYKRGNIYGSASPNPQQRNIRLNKTAIFLYALGFSEDDELQGKVINGIREMTAERGDRFEYPPPEGKRISYDEIKQAYNEKNKVVGGANAHQKNGIQEETAEQQIGIEESLANKVNRLLTMPISKKPDNEHTYGEMRAREVYIENVTNDNTDFGVSVIIKVTHQQSAAGEALHRDTYGIHYHGDRNGEGAGVRTWRALQGFLSEIEGQKTRIVYNQRLHRAQRISDIRMIAPVGSKIIYLMDNIMLKPYNIKEMRFIGV